MISQHSPADKSEYLRGLKDQLLLNPKEVQALYKISVNSLKKMRASGNGPTYCKGEKHILYTHDAIWAWVRANTVNSSGSDKIEPAVLKQHKQANSSEGYKQRS